MFDTIIFLSNILFFVSTMLIIKIIINMDFDNFLMVVKLKVFGITVLNIKINLLLMLYTINNSKKHKHLKLFISKKEAELLKQIKLNIIEKLYFDKVNVKSYIYVASPHVTAMTTAILNSLCRCAKIYLEGDAVDIQFSYNNISNFMTNNSMCEISLDVYFTIFDIIFAIIISLYRRRRYG